MAGEILETQTEQEHQDAVEDSEEREEKVQEAIEKIVTTIEELADAPPPAEEAVSEFETTLPMSPNDRDNLCDQFALTESLDSCSNFWSDLVRVRGVAVKLREGAYDRVRIDLDKIGAVVKAFHHCSGVFQRKLRVDPRMVISVALHI